MKTFRKTYRMNVKKVIELLKDVELDDVAELKALQDEKDLYER